MRDYEAELKAALSAHREAWEILEDKMTRTLTDLWEGETATGYAQANKPPDSVIQAKAKQLCKAEVAEARRLAKVVDLLNAEHQSVVTEAYGYSVRRERKWDEIDRKADEEKKAKEIEAGDEPAS